jgi:hypothetical protein
MIMDKESRPNTDDIKQVVQLFQYMEDQTKIINRNNKDIEELVLLSFE